ncbi:MAG TPA: ethanolamine ammonia-lyase subunit EutC [Bradyrhizobium sp.]|nr:ethanolamine ammonia-lyase subunit EutC [Bradyrhizobium sp.]
MKSPPPTSFDRLRELTSARVGLGRAGASLPTPVLLKFTLDHARARDAVHADFDVQGLMQGLVDLGLDVASVSSRAPRRQNYLARPDLGRKLDMESEHRLRSFGGRASRLAIVVGDGLSPTAVNVHAVGLLSRLLALLAADSIDVGQAVVARGARVALGDQIGAILNARMSVMLIGERPGLSAADSLGAYLTFDPQIGMTDEKRNCVSNIHGAGLSYDEAAYRIGWLIREGLARELTGVTLKDESGGRSPDVIAAKSG